MTLKQLRIKIFGHTKAEILQIVRKAEKEADEYLKGQVYKGSPEVKCDGSPK